MGTSCEQRDHIGAYYKQSHSAYKNWGKDLSREGIYGVHMGLDESSDYHDHHQAVARLTNEIIQTSGIQDEDNILDAGCGVGSISFEISSRFPNVKIVGINISPDQLNIANVFKKKAGLNNLSPYFLRNDYLKMSFKESTFDKIIFCESMTHSSDKQELLNEVYRVLKPNGKAVFFDAFDIRKSNSVEDEEKYRDLKAGWFIPSVPSLEQFISYAQSSGLSLVKGIDYSARVLLSAKLMGDHAEARLKESASYTSDIIQNSRLACIATRDLMMRGTMGYNALHFQK